MGSEPDYYRILGVKPTADQTAIEAAYRGRVLRLRLARRRHPERQLSEPDLEAIAHAYAVLADPDNRARYDAGYPLPSTPARRRVPRWLWGIVAVWLAAVILVVVQGIRSRPTLGDGPVGRFITTTVVAAQPAHTATIHTPATTTPLPTPTEPLLAPTLAVIPRPTTTPPLPTATPPPPTPTPIHPTPSPTFRPTDRIGVTVPVNLRSGPGTNFAILDVLPPGTLLEETGETETVNGFLWRRFLLADGAYGWIRDDNVLPAP